MSETIEKTFSVSVPAALAVSNISGSVEIHQGEEGTIKVTAVKRPFSGDDKRTEIEITQEMDGSVKAATRHPDGGWSWIFGSHPCDVDYVITAPRQCNIRVNGVSNPVSVEGFDGDTNIKTVSGEITLKNINGSVRIRAVSGNCEGEHLNGGLDVDTVSGDIVVKDSILAAIKGKTVSGDLRITTFLTKGPYEFKSVSGDVQLNAPPDTQCTLELHSLSGSLSTRFPTSGDSSSQRSRSVLVQGGGVTVRLNSVSGDLSLDCNGELPLPLETGKPISSEERKAVLESVERGEMTVEQALGKLNA